MKYTTLKTLSMLSLVAAFRTAAMAQCGTSFNAMATVAASVRSQAYASQSPVQNESAAAAADTAVNTTIVGL